MNTMLVWLLLVMSPAGVEQVHAYTTVQQCVEAGLVVESKLDKEVGYIVKCVQLPLTIS